jgi:hypothetical protein
MNYCTDPDFVNYFRNYKRIYYKVCRAAKRLHFEKNVACAATNKTKSIWNYVKTGTVTTKKKIENIILSDGGILVTEPLEVSNSNLFIKTHNIIQNTTNKSQDKTN